MSDTPAPADEMRQLTLRIKGITALHAEIADATKQLQRPVPGGTR